MAEIPGEQPGHALIFGSGSIGDGCLVRIHSRCLYGDALESDDCDCGPELTLSMDMIHAERGGVLIYLEQEGRGAGLSSKARGYRLSQNENLDTFASFERLGYDPDSRHYRDAAITLKALGLTTVRLLTNNPDKIAHLTGEGLCVQHVPLLTVPRSRRARRYLTAKRERRGHALPRTWWLCRIADGLLAAVFVGVASIVGAGLADGLAGVTGLAHHGSLSAAAALLVGHLGWSRTRLLRARFRLFCSGVSGLRLT
ncbi:GTP cyclohydrolase II [Nocardia sp. NPDC020380]|uniref:GTP cyclohydrolase II n=1 Tax=Nocardia sp. NPDC020380 TaxID=3364309 RepID=UPI00378DDCB5